MTLPTLLSVSGVPSWYVRLSRDPTVRLLLVPVMVYGVWLFETYLLEGQAGLFLRPEATGLYLYTLLCCLALGIIVPLFLIRMAFIRGEVTLFQLGFRSWYRTVVSVALTLLALGFALTFSTSGAGGPAPALIFLLLLPTGISTVMICWVLAGTHVQALVRDGGAGLSIPTGVVVTALLFGLAAKAQFPATATPDNLFWQIVGGMAVAVFFFLVRDVWSASVLVTGELVYRYAGVIPASSLYPAVPTLLASAAISISALIVVHMYLARYFLTIVAPLR